MSGLFSRFFFTNRLCDWRRSLAVLALLGCAAAADAQPIPTAVISPTPLTPFVSEDFSFTVEVSNAALIGSGFNGFNMQLELLVPPQVTLDLPATSPIFGDIPAVTQIVVPLSGSVTNPITQEVLTGLVPGMIYFLFEIPQGTVTPETPPSPLNFTANIDPFSGPGIVLDEPITAIALFGLGADPLNNPSTDPPIRNAAPGVVVTPAPSEQGVADQAPVIPVLYIPTKAVQTLDGNGTATGPNYPVTYTFAADIANGSTLASFRFEETLPDNLRFSGITDIQVNATSGDPNVTVVFTPYECGVEAPVTLYGPAPLSGIVYPLAHPAGTADMTQPPNDVSGGCLSIVFSAVTGEVGAEDVTVEYESYVSREDALDLTIIPPITGTDVLVSNTVTAGAATATGGYGVLDLTGADITTAPAEFNAESINTQKSMEILVDTGPVDLSPGDILRVTIRGQISDYFSHRRLAVHDIVGDALDFDNLNPANPQLILLRENGSSVPGLPVPFTRTNVDPAPDSNVPGEEYPFPAAGTLLVTENARPGDLSGASPGYTTLVFDLSAFWGHQCSVSGDACLEDADCPGVETCVETGDAFGGFRDGVSAATGFTDGIDDDTRFVLTYELTLQDHYENPASYTEDPSIDSFDEVSNSELIIGEITSDPAGEFIADAAGSGLQIPPTSLEKELVALNGNDVLPDPVQVVPGDDVTYLLRITIPTGNTEVARIDDYLPLPIFRTDDPDADGIPSGWTFNNVVLAPGVYPAAGEAAFGPGTSVVPPDYEPTDDPPAIVTSVDGNRVSFNFPDQITFEVVTPQEIVVEILFTIRAGYDPFSDNLFLTNLAEATFGNSLGNVRTQAAARFLQREPALRIFKGVAATTGGGVISPSPLVLPIDGDLAGADAGDTVTYVITVENVGGFAAYDVVVTDPEVPGMDPGSCTIVSVTYGDGSALGYAGDLVAGIALATELALNDGTIGAPFSTDTALITVDCTMAADVEPHQVVTNRARITSFASISGGPNFVDPGDPNAYSDDALVTMAPPQIAKVIESVSPEAAGPGVVTAGDVVTYAITVTLPEGETTGLVVVDSLPPGFEYVVGSVAVDVSGYVGAVTVAPGIVVGGSVAAGQTITLTFGDATTTDDNDTTNNSFLVRLEALVRGDAAQNDGLPALQAKTNNVTLDYDTNPGAPLSANAGTQFGEPELQITKSVNPPTADGSDTLTITLVVSNTGTAPAYDVIVTDPLDGDLFDLGTILEDTTPADFTYSYVSPTVTYTMDPGSSILPGGTRTFIFTGQVRADVTIQTSYDNTADVTGDSQDGVVPSERETIDDDTASVLIDTVTVTKTIIATSEAHTSDAALNSTPPVAIGEVVTFRIVFQMPEGITRAVRLADVLPTGLQHIPGSAFLTRNSAALTAANNVGDAPSLGINVEPPGTAVPITLSGVTGEILIDLGDVTNSDNNNATDETYTLELDVVVQNIAGNTPNTTRANRGRFRYQDAMATEFNITTPNRSVRIATPVVSVAKDALPLSGAAGDVITFTARIRNTAPLTAAGTAGFDWTFEDVLPSEYINPSLVSVDLTGAPAAIVIAGFVGNTLSGTIDRLDPGQFVDITYEAEIDVSAQFGQDILNTICSQSTSLPGTNGTGGVTPGVAGTSTGERTGTGGVNNLAACDNAAVAVEVPVITKTTVNPQAWFAIGEEPRFRVTVGIPAGTTNQLLVTDVLPAGLSFNAGTLSVVAPAGFVSSNGALVEGNAAFFTQAGQTLTFNFGTATVPNAGNIVIEYDTTVENVLANQDGVLLTNTATLQYEDPDNPPALITEPPVVNDTPVRVGEPDLEMTKSILAGAVGSQAGDTITWEVTIRNDGHTTAYRTAWIDILPDGGGGPGASDGLEQISNVNVAVAGGTIVVNATALPVVSGDAILSTTTNTDDTIALPLLDIEPGATLTVTFDSLVGVNAVIGASLVNITSADYNSLPGGGGRDGSDGPGVDDDDDSDLNNYEESVNETLTLGSPIAIDKTVSPTAYTIGEDISFFVRVTLFEGVTEQLVVTDVLPSGLSFRSSSVSLGNMGITISNPTYATPIIGGPGEFSFDFGDVNNPPDVSALNDFVEIEIVARVDNILANQDGTILENNAFLEYGPGATRLDFDSDGVTPGIQGREVEVVEPDLEITKTVAPSSQSLGDVVTFTVNVAHTAGSTSDAFDLSLVDILPVGLTIDPASVTLPPLDYVVAGQMLTVSRSVLTLADASFSFTYQATIDLDAVVGQPLTNGIDVQWSSLPGSTGDPDDGRTGSGGVNDYNDADDDTVTPNINAFVDALKTVVLLNDADASGTVTPGDTLRYTVVLTNDVQTVDNVVFTDVLPSHTTYVAASLTSDAGVTDDSGAPTLLVDIGTMLVGSTVTITFDVTVNGGTPDGTLICNQGSVDSDQTVPEPTDVDGIDANGDQCTPSVVGAPPVPRNQLYVEKRVSLLTDVDASGSVTPGDVLRYLLVFHNLGDQDLTTVTFNDNIPTGLTGIPASGAITGAGAIINVTANTVSSLIPTIVVGTTESATFDVTIDAPLFDGSGDGDPNRETFVNQGVADSDQTPPVLSDENGDPTDGDQPTDIEAVDGVPGAPDIDAQKRVALSADADGDGLVDPLDELTYTITVTNSGSADALNVVLVDPQPNDTTIVLGSTATSQGAVVGETPVTVNLGTLPVGGVATITFRVTVDAATPGGTIIVNQAVVTGDNFPPEDSDDNGDDSDGENPNRTPVDDTPPGSGGPGQPQFAKALLSSTEPDTAGTNVAIGEIVTYRVTATLPPGTTRQVELADTLPAGLAYVPGSATLARVFDTAMIASANPASINSAASGVPVALADGTDLLVAGQALTLFLGDVINSDAAPNDERYLLEYRAVVRNVVGNQRGTSLVNAAELSFWNGLSQETTEAAAETLTVVEPELTIDKTAAPSPVAASGDTVTFTITVTNPAVANASVAYDARIMDTVPAVFTGVSALTITPSGGVAGVVNSSGGNLVDVAVGVFPPGGQLVLVFTGNIAPPYSSPGVTNTADVVWSSLPGDNGTGDANPEAPGTPLGERDGTGGVNDHATTDDAFIETPVLHLSKTDNPDPVRPGGTLTYTIFLTNSSTEPLINVQLFETYDPRTTFVSSVPPPSVGNSQWNLGDLPAGGSTTVTVTMVVNAGLADGEILLNNAQATSDGGGFVEDNEPTTVIEPSLTSAQLLVQKAASQVSVPASGVVTYTVSIRNDGLATSYDTVLSDDLPPELTYANAVPAPDFVAGNYIEWNVGNLPPGASQSFTVYAFTNPTLVPGTLIENCADGLGQVGPGTTPGAGLSAQGCAASTVSGAADCDLIARKRAVGLMIPGNEFVYRCLWCDPCVDATGVVLVDELPPQLEFVSLASKDVTSFTLDGQRLEMIVAQQPAGRAATADIRVRVRDDAQVGSVVSNTLVFTDGALREANGTHNGVVRDDTTNPKTTPSLKVSGNKRAVDGARVNYTARYQNMPAGSTITVETSDGINLSSISPTPTADAVPTAFRRSAGESGGGELLVWGGVSGSGTIKLRGNVTMNAPAAARIVSVEVRASDGLTEIHSGSDTVVTPSAGGGSSSAGNKAQAMVRSPRYVRPGVQAQAMLRYRALADGGAATLSLPSGAALVTAVPAPTTVDGGVLTWDGLTGLSGAIKVRVTIPPDAATGSTLAFAGSVRDSRGTVSDSAVSTVRDGSSSTTKPTSLALTPQTQVVPGAQATATLRFMNAPAGSTIVLALPAGVSPVFAIPAAASSESGILQWAVGGSAKISLRLDVAAGLPSGATLPLDAVLTDPQGNAQTASGFMTVR